MKSLDITQAVETGWHTFARRGWYLIGITAGMSVMALFVLGNAFVTALYSIVVSGFIVLLLKHSRNEEYSFDDLFLVDARWIYFVFGTLIKSFLIAVGLLFFIVPGVYLAIRFMFSELYILDKGMRPIEALRASSELTAGYKLDLFFYLLLVVLISLVGLLAFGVGLLVAIPVVNLANIALFWKLQELQYLNSLEKG